MKKIHVNFLGKYGLSNRIRSMAGHYALAKISGSDLSFEWHKDDSCPGDFYEVFENVGGINYLLNPESERLALDQYDIYSHSSSKPIHCGSHPDSIYNTFHESQNIDPELFKNYVSEFYRKLKPSESVIGLTHKLLKNLQNAPAKILGVHVRRTDMIDHSIKNGITPPSDETLLFEIREYLKRNDVHKIYVAADNPHSIEMMRENFKDLVIILDGDWELSLEETAANSKIQARLTSLTKAVADVYILSKCSYIIGTQLSSFSTFAASWGNVSYKRV